MNASSALTLDRFATTGVGMVPITARKYDGAVAVGSLFVMAPQDEDSIGILDAETLIITAECRSPAQEMHEEMGSEATTKRNGTQFVGGKVGRDALKVAVRTATFLACNVRHAYVR